MATTATACLGNVAVLHLRSVKKQPAFVGRKQTSYDLAKSRFPGPVFTEQRMHLAGDEAGRDIVDRVRRTEALVNILEDDDFPRSGRWDAQSLRKSFGMLSAASPRSQTTRSAAPDVRSDRAAVPDNQPDAAAAFIGRQRNDALLCPLRRARTLTLSRSSRARRYGPGRGCAIDKNDAPDFDGPVFMVPAKPGALFPRRNCYWNASIDQSAGGTSVSSHG